MTKPATLVQSDVDPPERSTSAASGFAHLVPVRVLERMTGSNPALSAWEAYEPTARWCFQAQRWPFGGPCLVAFLEGSWPVGARAVDQDGHRPTLRRLRHEAAAARQWRHL